MAPAPSLLLLRLFPLPCPIRCLLFSRLLPPLGGLARGMIERGMFARLRGLLAHLVPAATLIRRNNSAPRRTLPAAAHLSPRPRGGPLHKAPPCLLQAEQRRAANARHHGKTTPWLVFPTTRSIDQFTRPKIKFQRTTTSSIRFHSKVGSALWHYAMQAWRSALRSDTA